MVTAPIAPRIPTTRIHHDRVFTDPYEWLRDKDSPEVIAHLEAENAHTDDALARLQPLRERIFEEIKGRVRETDLSVPATRRLVVLRTLHRGQAVRRAVPGADDGSRRLDSSAERRRRCAGRAGSARRERRGRSAMSSSRSAPSASDARRTRMLWGVDLAGDERYTVRVRDIATGERASRSPRGDLIGGASFTARRQVHRVLDRRRCVAPGSACGCTASARPAARTMWSCSTRRTNRFWVGPASRAATSSS